jgi:hypothetical protein
MKSLSARNFSSLRFSAGRTPTGSTMENLRHTIQPITVGCVALIAQAVWRSFFWHIPVSASVNTARLHLLPFAIGAGFVAAAMLVVFMIAELCAGGAVHRTSRFWRAAHVVSATLGAVLLFSAMLLVVSAP